MFRREKDFALFSTIEGKTNLVEFFTQSFRDNLRAREHQQIVRRVRIFPRDYRDPLSRGYICSEARKTER